MNKMQEQVREFHRAIGAATSPAEPEFRDQVLRARLIVEEALETACGLLGTRLAAEVVVEALNKMGSPDNPKLTSRPDLLETLDGLCDTIVVCLGTAEVIGVDLEPFFDEVMRANMAKVGGPVREDGKQLKPEGWTPPDIAGVLERQRVENACSHDVVRSLDTYPAFRSCVACGKQL